MNKSLSKWQKKNTTTMCIRFNNFSDADILKFLNQTENKTGIIKDLIRAEMARQNFVCPHPSRKEVEAYEKYLDELEEKGEVGDYEA